MLDFRGIESPPMNNLVLRVVFISISRAEYILVEASFRNTHSPDVWKATRSTENNTTTSGVDRDRLKAYNLGVTQKFLGITRT